MRRSRGSLQGWNNRYRGNIQSLNDQVLLQEQEKARLQSEVNDLIEQKRLVIIQRDKVKAELRKIEIEANIAAAKIRENHSWYGKFMILWNFIRLVFDVPPDIDSNGILDNPKNPNSPTIINDLDDLRDKSAMRTDFRVSASLHYST